MLLIKKVTYFIFFLLTFTISIRAQECTWVEGEGEWRVVNITPEQAKFNALNLARENAKSKVRGYKLTEQIYRSITETMTGTNASEFYDAFSKFVSLKSDARIIKEEKPIYTYQLDGEDQVIKVKLKACVIEEKSLEDPSFKVDLKLNKSIFYDKSYKLGDGEKIIFTINSTRDCYLYLFNILSNDSVVLILPNKYITDNKFVLGQREQEFEKKIKTLGMNFYAELPEGKEQAIEGFFLIALKEKIDPPADIFSNDDINKTFTYKTAFRDIVNNWLGKIPLEKQTEKFEKYEIRKAESYYPFINNK
jgi:hypothetical protein